jgi:predicted nucleic acid-binding protein
VNVVDSCGWLEYFGEGPNAPVFAPVIEDTERVLVPTVCLTEVFKVMHRQRGEDAAVDAMHAMNLAKIVDLGAEIAVAAAKLGLERDLPLADSVILATARAHGATLWTQDEHFKGVDGVEYVEAK